MIRNNIYVYCIYIYVIYPDISPRYHIPYPQHLLTHLSRVHIAAIGRLDLRVPVGLAPEAAARPWDGAHQHRLRGGTADVLPRCLRGELGGRTDWEEFDVHLNQPGTGNHHFFHRKSWGVGFAYTQFLGEKPGCETIENCWPERSIRCPNRFFVSTKFTWGDGPN